MRVLRLDVWAEDLKAIARASRVWRSATGLALALVALTIVALGQTSDTSNQSWTSTSDSQDSSVGRRTRKSESHTQDGNRTVDKQSVEILRSGSYGPYQDIEKESVQVSATTSRTVVRTYGRNSEGQRVLLQLTEEERQTFPSGGGKVVRSTSNPDANGRVQLVQREVQDTKKTSATVEETTTTVMLPDVNGGLAPAMKIQERHERTGDHTVQVQKSTLLPDGAGNWQAGEVKQSTITDDGKNRAREEHVLRANPDGQLAEVYRTVGKESQDASGESHGTIETYSTEVPGSSSDGSLHLIQRETTASSTGASGARTTQHRVEQLNPGAPSAGLQVTIQSTDSQNSSPLGTQQTSTVQVRGPNGSLNVVSVDMTKSDKTPAVEVQVVPPPKAK
jgi:sirohydrochlorin ferrochelatase